MLGIMDIARVVSAKKLKGSGLNLGDVVVVAGTQMVPAKRQDPYLQRMLVKVAQVKEGQPVFEPVYLVDPRSLEKLSDEEIKNLELKG